MNIGVFCASADRIDETYFEDATKLGREIGRRSWGLIYGGTNCGLMREVADATLENGGRAVGIIPECIYERGVAAANVSELVVMENMKERKNLMRERSDAFIALPGGWGTLEEITEVITLKQLGCHCKPIVFVNTSGFYDKFFNFIGKIREEGFISSAYDELYCVVEKIDDAFSYLENYQVESLIDKYSSN